MKTCLLLFWAFLLSLPTHAYTGVSFYVVAHQDDWQLFMTPNSFGDLVDPNGKVVFIYVTAGDDGLGTGSGPQASLPYYRARENGAVVSAQYVSNQVAGLGFNSGDGVFADVSIEGKVVTRYTYKNAVHYFLRLRDKSAPEGGGGLTGPTLLSNLWRNDIPLSTVTGSSVYRNKNELKAVVQRIFIQESANIPYKYANRFRYDLPNSIEHTDHVIAGEVAGAADMYLGFEVYGFIGYACIAKYGAQSYGDSSREATIWGKAAEVVAAAGYFDTRLDEWHQSFVGFNCFVQMIGSSLVEDRSSASMSQAATTPTPSLSWDVYPVPAKDKLLVRVPAEKVGANGTVSVYNAQSTKVRTIELSSLLPTAPYTYALDIATLPAGTYFIQLATPENSWTRQIVKEN